MNRFCLPCWRLAVACSVLGSLLLQIPTAAQERPPKFPDATVLPRGVISVDAEVSPTGDRPSSAHGQGAPETGDRVTSSAAPEPEPEPAAPPPPPADTAVAALSSPQDAFATPRPSFLVPDYPTFNSRVLDQQLHLYSRYLAEFGTPDVLIVGSSRSLQGIDPAVLQEALAAHGHGPLRVYNFGVNGATAQVIDLIVRRILKPEHLPRLIIWADGLRAFNSNRLDITYNGIVSSEGYKRLGSGVYPIGDQAQVEVTIPPAEICIDLPGPSASERVAIAPITGSNSFAPNLPDPAEPATANDPQPDEGAVPVADPLLLAATPCDRRASDAHSEGGDRSVSAVSELPEVPEYQYISQAQFQRRNSAFSVNGFQSVTTRFNPSTYYRQFPRVPGRYDSDYMPLRLDGGEQARAMVALAHYVRQQGIGLVLVNLPLSQEYLDPQRQQGEQQFSQFMERTATQEGFIFRNLVRLWVTRSDYFADPSHLNHDGARAVAQQLAGDPTIPWQMPLSSDF